MNAEDIKNITIAKSIKHGHWNLLIHDEDSPGSFIRPRINFNSIQEAAQYIVDTYSIQEN